MLKVTELNKEYKDKVAIADINITFPDKGLIIIKGESGSGKTTLLNMLTANDFATSGKVEYKGVEITPKNAEQYRRQYCGNIYQDFMLIEDLSVKENIELALQVVGQDYTTDDIIELLNKVDLPQEYLDKKVSKLSGGEKQRVAIARAISKQNAMIFADEPTGNLDSKTGAVIMKLLKGISEDRLVVVVSHNEKFNKKYADYTLTLEDGNIESSDLPEYTQKEENEEENNRKVVFDKKNKNLKPKTLVRLALWGFGKNRVKVTLSIIAFIVFCMLSTTFLTASLVNHNLALAKTLDNCTQRNVIIQTADYADSKSIENYYKNSTYKSSLVYPFNYTLRSDVLDEKDEEKIEYGIVYDKEAGADVTILYGNFPQEANEIALSYYLALFMSQKIKDYMTDNVKDLIGKDFIYRGLYYFKIVGIFDEGRYVDDFDQLSDANEKYIKQINFMARSVFFGEGVEKLLNNNDVIFYPYAPAETYKCLYNEKQVICLGYDNNAFYGKDYPQLQKGEIYIDRSFAREKGLEAGDSISIDIGHYIDFSYFEQQVFRKKHTLENLKIKQVVEGAPCFYDFIILSSDDYEECMLVNGQNKYNVKGLYFNAKDIKNSYAFFNKISKESKGLFEESENNPQLNVMLQNMGVVNNVYKYSIVYARITAPLTGIVFFGMIVIGAVSTMYLMATKEKSYNILRAIGCGKKNIALFLIIQLFTILLIELTLGLIFAKISCVGINNIVLAKTLGVSNSVITEEMLIIGWLPPVTVIALTVLQTLLSVVVKTKYIFSKSVMENKTR